MAIIQKRSLVDKVYERVRSDIITLQYPLGERINVNELQDTLGVSSTPIREALNRLQQEGLVEYENNVGARVIHLTPKDVQEIQQAATTLHCAAARLALERGNADAIAVGLRKYLSAFEKATNTEEQVMSVHHFIGVFYAQCGNSRLDKSMLAIQGQQLLVRYLYAQGGIDREKDLLDYREIYSCSNLKDGNGVANAIWRNGRRLEQTLVARMRAEAEQGSKS